MGGGGLGGGGGGALKDSQLPSLNVWLFANMWDSGADPETRGGGVME